MLGADWRDGCSLIAVNAIGLLPAQTGRSSTGMGGVPLDEA